MQPEPQIPEELQRELEALVAQVETIDQEIDQDLAHSLATLDQAAQRVEIVATEIDGLLDEIDQAEAEAEEAIDLLILNEIEDEVGNA